MKWTQCYYEIRKSGRSKQLDILLPFYRVAQTQTTWINPIDLEMGNMTNGCFFKSETKEIVDFLKNYTLEQFYVTSGFAEPFWGLWRLLKQSLASVHWVKAWRREVQREQNWTGVCVQQCKMTKSR